MGPVLWQLPANFHRDDDRLGVRARAAPAGPPLLRVPPPELVHSEVYGLLHTYGVALVIGDDSRRPLPPAPLTADWTLIRFHYGRRGRRGNYSETELREWAARIAELRSEAEVLAYFNNDWEGVRGPQRPASEAAAGGLKPA